MENTTAKKHPTSRKLEKTFVGVVFDFLASIQLGTFLILALFVLTWFATLEQTVIGLRPMMDKYFNWKELFFFPEIGKPMQGDGVLIPMKIYFPMPSGFWLCVLFTLNLLLGGLIRFRKSPQKIGILLTHFSIVFMMIAAGVTKFTEKRGMMPIYEGETSDAAQDYNQEVIEISELADGKVTKVHLIDSEQLKDLRPRKGGLIGFFEGEPIKERLYRLKGLPFDLHVSNLDQNAVMNPAQFIPPTRGEKVLQGFYMRKLPAQKETEVHTAAAEVKVQGKNGEEITSLYLATRSEKPATVMVDGRPYLLRMRKKLWPLPFAVKLDDFRLERDPGTMRAAAYESDITRVDGERSEEVLDSNERAHAS